jgi:hypothetical protein
MVSKRTRCPHVVSLRSGDAMIDDSEEETGHGVSRRGGTEESLSMGVSRPELGPRTTSIRQSVPKQHQWAGWARNNVVAHTGGVCLGPENAPGLYEARSGLALPGVNSPPRRAMFPSSRPNNQLRFAAVQYCPERKRCSVAERRSLQAAFSI